MKIQNVGSARKLFYPVYGIRITALLTDEHETLDGPLCYKMMYASPMDVVFSATAAAAANQTVSSNVELLQIG